MATTVGSCVSWIALNKPILSPLERPGGAPEVDRRHYVEASGALTRVSLAP